MTVSRIATATQNHSVLADLMRAQARQVDAQREVSTGKRGDDLLGFADRASSLVASQSVKARVDGLVEQLGATDVRLQAQQLSLESLSNGAEGLKAAIAGALASDNSVGLMSQVQAYFSQTLEALNAQYGDGYLFSGGQTATPPVNVTTLAGLTAAPSAAAVFANGTLPQISRTDDDSSLQTGFLANTIGEPMMQAMRALQAFNDGASGPFNGPLTAAQRTFLEAQLQVMDAVAQGTVSTVAQGGVIQKRVETALAAQTDRQVTLEGIISDISDVGIAESASHLSQAQTAVQASAQVFLSLKDMSLLNYLK